MQQERPQQCLFDQANLLSKLTFWWLNPLFGKHPARVARDCDQYDVPASDESDLLERRLDRCWKKEVQEYSEGNEANLLKAVLSAFLLQWILPGALLLLAEVARLAQPVLLGWLLDYISGYSQLTETKAYLYGLGLGCMIFLHAVLSTVYMFLAHRVALKMKTALEALVYRKVMSLSSEAALQTSSAAVIQQLATNTDTFSGAVEQVHYLWVGPLQLAVLLFLLHREVGVAGLLCLAIVAAIVALQAVLEPLAARLREKSETWTEQRRQMTHRILAAILQVKVTCLETILTPLITSLRSKEMPWLRGSATFQGLVFCLVGISCRLMLLLVASVASKEELTLRSLFMTFALLDLVMWCLWRFPVRGVRDVLALRAALQDVQRFLLLDEEKEQIKDLRLHRSVSYRNEPYADWVVDIDHMTARWRTVHTGERKRFQKRRTRSSTSSTKSLLHESDADHAFSLKYLSLQVKKGELLAVVGLPHSGKTSLLMTLIGELPYEIGQISVNGRVAYCPQTPWLFSASVRENIIFGDAYDATRYDMVVRACSLAKLFEMLPEGDQTEVGERGLQLSGGYVARITLARAMYNNADIYLLDDILVHVDSSTRQELFKRCVGGVLSGKTRIVVTQNWQCLRAADRIAVLREGSLFDVGSLEDLQSRGVDVREFVYSDSSQRRAQVEAEEEFFHVRLKLLGQAHGAQENVGDGRSDTRTFFSFLTGSHLWMLLLPLVVVLWLGSQATISAADWMLARWISDATSGLVPATSYSPVATAYPVTTPLHPVTVLYQPGVSAVLPDANLPSGAAEPSPSGFPGLPNLYIVLLCSAVGMAVLCVLVVTQMCVTAAHALHDKMLSVVMRARANFFFLTSTDEILSVFTQHLMFIDTCVPQLAYLSTEMSLRVLAMVVLMCVVSPWLVLAVLLMLVTIAALQVIGNRTLQGVRSFRETARALVYTDIGETLKGLQTIHAFRRQDHFLKGFDSHLNSLTWARFLSLCTFSRLAIICLLIAVLFVSVVIYVSIALSGGLDSGLLALVMVYCVTLILPLQVLLQSSVGLGNQMASVDRAVSLACQDQEPAWFSDKPPPEDWPNRGSITFSRTSLMVGPDGPFIISDIDVHVKSKEKVGVVGEPGSGKYSLMSLMLRLQHVQGMLFIDGFDVLKIGLHELRKNISVVPQEPVLFPGTLRENLDPGGANSDEQLWATLERVGLREKVSSVRGGLSADLGDDTAIFSLGQRQLVCLARALLKKTKIILFEEAADASEHGLTDHIQRTLRAKFRDCTVLMVAHRLASVMDCDRIMVFHEGQVKEFDTPHALLQQERGYFTRLAEQLGKRQLQQLRGMAELSQQQRASASLMLEHAVFMATEQLHASTEDLTFRPGSLAWSHIAKFSKSQDSLEKAYSDWGSKGDVREENGAGDTGSSVSKPRQPPSMGPAQKIISKRRMSPNRGKRHHGDKSQEDREGVEEKTKSGGEQMPLMSYDAPPRPPTHQRGSYERRGRPAEEERRRDIDDVGVGMHGRGGDRSGNRQESSPLLDYNSSPKPRIRSPTSQQLPADISAASGGRSVTGRRVLETAIDTPPSRHRNFPSASDSSNHSPTSPSARGSNPSSPTGKMVYSHEPRARLISGEYSPPSSGGKEDTERIIYC